MAETALAELQDRMVKARSELKGLFEDAIQDGREVDAVRLSGKQAGVGRADD